MLDKSVQECPNCKESFPCFTTLMVHSHEHALPNVKQFVSDKSKRNTIDNPKNSKTTSNQLLLISYDCYICDGSYSTRELLVQHSNSHLLGHPCQSAQCQQLYGCGIKKETSINNCPSGNLTSAPTPTEVSIKITNIEIDPESNHHLKNSSNKSNPYQEDNEGKSDNKKRRKSESSKSTTTNKPNQSKYSNNSSNNSPDSTTQVQVRKKSSTESKSALTGLKGSPHKKLKRSYQCKTCQKILSSKISHIEHTRLHTNEKPYKCQICSKSFAVKNTFRQHMTLHSGSRPKNQDASLNCKTGNKTYKCSICWDIFPTREKLDYHTCPTMSRRGESFRCKICGKTFAQKDWRTRHYLTSHNNGESCFRCEICGEIFPDEQFYLIHAQDHFSREIKKAFLDCHVCGRTFPGKELYERHSCRCAAVVSSR